MTKLQIGFWKHRAYTTNEQILISTNLETEQVDYISLPGKELPLQRKSEEDTTTLEELN